MENAEPSLCHSVKIKHSIIIISADETLGTLWGNFLIEALAILSAVDSLEVSNHLIQYLELAQFQCPA